MSNWPIVLPARLIAGEIRFNRKRLDALLVGAKDCELEILIERLSATRSIQQNRFYFGLILRLISEHTGDSKEDLHEFFKLKFNVKTLVLCNQYGEIVGEERIGQSTTKLNKVLFMDYCEAVRQFALEKLDIVIPDPDPNWRQNPEEVIG